MSPHLVILAERVDLRGDKLCFDCTKKARHGNRAKPASHTKDTSLSNKLKLAPCEP